MTDQVLMPGADYQAICNAVRALTGGKAALKSGDIAGALAGVKCGAHVPMRQEWREQLQLFAALSGKPID